MVELVAPPPPSLVFYVRVLEKVSDRVTCEHRPEEGGSSCEASAGRTGGSRSRPGLRLSEELPFLQGTRSVAPPACPELAGLHRAVMRYRGVEGMGLQCSGAPASWPEAEAQNAPPAQESRVRAWGPQWSLVGRRTHLGFLGEQERLPLAVLLLSVSPRRTWLWWQMVTLASSSPLGLRTPGEMN